MKGGEDWPATRWDGSVRIGHLVSVDRGQHLSFQVPDMDRGVGGGAHDELTCRGETLNQPIFELHIFEDKLEHLSNSIENIFYHTASF